MLQNVAVMWVTATVNPHQIHKDVLDDTVLCHIVDIGSQVCGKQSVE